MSGRSRLLMCFMLGLAAAASLRDPARAVPGATAGLSPQHRDVLARIDSRWEANAGLAAHEEIARHIATARAEADSLFLLNLLYREGRLLAALNRSLDAEPVLDEGMRLATVLDEPLLYRACLHWHGVALIGLGRLQKVQRCFEELLRLSRESADAYHEGYAWMGLAYHDWQSNKPGEARDKYLRSVRIFRRLGQVRGELWALVGLNNALTMLGDYDEAIAGHRRIVAMGKESGSPEIEALGHNNLGVLLFSLGDTGEALAHFQRAAELQEQYGNAKESIIAGMNVSICEVALGRTRKASLKLRDLLERSRENRYADVQVSLLKELANAHLQQGDFRLAGRMFREALGLPDGLTPKSECETVIGLSEAMARMDSTAFALRLLRSRSGRMLKLQDARIQFAFRNELAERLLDEGLPREALEMATAVEERGADLGLTALRLDALPLIAEASLKLGMPDSAAALLQRGARLWEEHRGLPLDPEWREQRGAAARRLFSELTWLTLRHPSDRPREERVREAFDLLQRYKGRTLLERMMGPGGREVPVQQASAVTLDELQERVLLSGELLLDFTVGPQHSLLFACTRQESRALVLPGEDSLSGKVRLFHELVATRPGEAASPAEIEAIASTARSLTGSLFSSCADMIARSRHLIVVPDGALNLLPFAYLLRTSEMSRATGQAESPQAGPSDAGRAVSQAPAATVLAWLRRDADRTGGTGSSSRRILALAGRQAEHGEYLAGAKREVALLARRFAGVTTRLGPAAARGNLPNRLSDSAFTLDIATEDTLPEALAPKSHVPIEAFEDFEIIHFAGHSTVDDQSPWRSLIQLELEPGESDEALLQASEIAGWKLPARLVVLSSCQSAGGRILSGEGVQGLASAFLSARVPCVVATLWPVDDRVTVDFMIAFYDALSDGRSVSQAMLRAQDVIRAQPRTAHPFYWAGFVSIGQGETHIGLLPRTRAHLLWWTAALIPVIIWIALKTSGRKQHGPR